jgi:hypothetical protein
MSLSLLSVGALAAMAALAVPLLVHLVRRSEQRPLDFAALRWIRARQRPQRRPALDEKVLLGVRLLVLALAALFLAQPVWRDASGARSWVVLVPGVELAAARSLALPEEAEWRWLAPGFPPVGTPTPGIGSVPISSLLRELDAGLPASVSVTVVAPPLLAGVDGERPSLGRPVEWRVTRGAEPRPVADPSPGPRVAIRHAPERSDGARYLAAATRAWHPQRESPAAADVAASLALPAGSGTDVLFWLHPGAVPREALDWASAGRTLVTEPDAAPEGVPDAATVTWRDEDAAPLATVEPLGGGRLVRLQRPLLPEELPEMLQPEFPARLLALLQAPALPATVPAEAHAPLRAAWTSNGEGLDAAVRALQPWLALVIALLMGLERWLATRPVRWRP